MMIEVLKSKIHCARLNYMGSITIDEDLDGRCQHDCR